MSTSTKNIVIFGLRDLAEMAWYYLVENHKIDSSNPLPIAFTVDSEYITQDTFHNLPITPFETLEQQYPPSEYDLFAPIADNKRREMVYSVGKSKGYDFFTYISPQCTNYASSIGENCFILEDNTLQPFTTIGNNVILWSGNHIGHHGKIQDHVFITSHVVISGHCIVKNKAWIGVNSTIRDGVTIGEGSLIAMGSLIAKDVEDNSFYMGFPAKKQNKLPGEVN